MWRSMRAAAATVVGTAVIGATLSVVGGSAAQADQITQGVDNLRTNWDAGESGLSPAVVQSSAFGQLFATQLDGQIYAQPLTVGDEVIAVTENNTAYGLDRRTGHIDWQRNFGPAFPASAIGCGDLTPSIGASATPVYDPATNAVYFTTKVDDGTATHRHPTWLMHAVDPSTGAERDGWPVTISGKPGNAANITFDPYYEQQRPGLLLMDGVVYAGFGAHCDVVPYRGYVVGVGVAEHQVTSMWASETGDSVAGAGVWQSGGGLVSDGPGRIFFSTGNGISPAPGPGTTVQGNLAESVVRLQVNADKSLSTADFFSPSNAASLDLQDQDISSGAPMALPDGFGTAAHPHLMVQQGKDGRVFLLDRDNLGGMSQAPGGGNAVVSTSGPYQGLWGHPAFWGGDGGYVYLVGNNGPLRALAYGVNNGNPALTFTGRSQDSFGYTSGSPLVTSNGTDDSTGLIWVVSANDASGAGGTLRAYSPVPDGDGLLQLLWSAPVGTATKFSTPTADKGVVYVGTRDGVLYGFGSPATTALTAAPVDFGQVAVGASGTGTMTLTATKDLGITGLTASGAFAVTAGSLPSAGQPTQLASGASLDVPLSFTPKTTGGISGMLTANLSDGEKLVFALHGVGTRPGLGAAPGSLGFGEVPTGSVSTLNLQITNTGTGPETVDSVTAPAGAFSATGLPAAGTVVPAGGSFVATVAYAPVVGSPSDSDALVVNSSSAGQSHALKVTVGGSAVTGQGHLEFSPSSLDFGKVPIGSSKTLTFTISNTGNLPVTVTKAKAPAGDFGSAVQLSEGLVIGPEQSTVQSVTFTPRSTTAQSGGFYEVTGDAGQGAQFVPVSGTGTGTPATTTVADGSWHANGTAAISDDGSVQLTPASPGNQAGSAVYTKPLPTDGLRATFTAKFGPGTGGYGIAFSLLDPVQNTGSAVGGSGTGFGIAGQQGTVVALGTGWSPATGLQNYVAVGTSTAGSPNITYTSKAPLATALRQGTHQVDIESTGGHLYVRIDGTQVMDSTQALPPTALLALSAGTGVNSDAHKVSGVVVSDMPPTTPPTAAAPPFLARDTTGTLWQYRTTGNAAAPFQARQKVGGGWQVYNALISLSTRTATAHADLVARDASGVLWYYAGTGNTTTPLAPRVRVGAGWGIYGTMTGVGDVTGDGKADLVARDSSGVLWLYRGTGVASAPFAARTRIGAGWGIYGTMTGVGDVTGDGKADLVARDSSGVLWLYRGTGVASAPFAARTRVGSGWNTYGMLTAVGDVTGDGKADLVARDATGVLWLYRGTGVTSAPFAARSRVGSGWNTYNALV
nr:choice-of-anchor D domain-containing protein [Actinacidiphila rubida]